MALTLGDTYIQRTTQDLQTGYGTGFNPTIGFSLNDGNLRFPFSYDENTGTGAIRCFTDGFLYFTNNFFFRNSPVGPGVPNSSMVNICTNIGGGNEKAGIALVPRPINTGQQYYEIFYATGQGFNLGWNATNDSPGSPGNAAVVFKIAGTEHMRMVQSQYPSFLLGTSTKSVNGNEIMVVRSANVTTPAMRLVHPGVPSSSYSNLWVFGFQDLFMGAIVINNNSVALANVSDYRVKTDIAPLGSVLSRVSRLNPVRFNWLSSPDAPLQLGFVAHEVQEVFPDFVNGQRDGLDEDGRPQYQALDQMQLLPWMVRAVQELIDTCESMKTNIGVTGA